MYSQHSHRYGAPRKGIHHVPIRGTRIIMYPENWTGDEDRMLCQEEMELRRGEMSTQRKQYSAECKARVALEALKGRNTVNELASTYGVHPTQIAHWKHRLHKQ